MRRISRCLLIYDIACQWQKNFHTRLKASPSLVLQSGIEIMHGIGDFHVKGHVLECLPRYGLGYIQSIGIIDREILETLWSVLNQSSRSAAGASLAHHKKILDDHMNYSNWKKLTGIGLPSSYAST